MLKKLLMTVLAFAVTTGLAFASVEVNNADQAALDGIKGIGPATSKSILAERSKGGNFKDWADFEVRVKGVGAKNAVKFSEAGLTVNGQFKTMTTAKADMKSDAKAAGSAKTDMKTEQPKVKKEAAPTKAPASK